jgi:hypothetical protein
VDHYSAAIGRLFIEAEPPGQTPDLLLNILREMEAEEGK